MVIQEEEYLPEGREDHGKELRREGQREKRVHWAPEEEREGKKKEQDEKESDHKEAGPGGTKLRQERDEERRRREGERDSNRDPRQREGAPRTFDQGEREEQQRFSLERRGRKRKRHDKKQE
jgi:hypothetical protein